MRFPLLKIILFVGILLIFFYPKNKLLLNLRILIKNILEKLK